MTGTIGGEDDEILARVISERDSEDEDGYQYGAQFLGLSGTLRDVIARHVFRLQRENVHGALSGDGTPTPFP